MMRVLCGAGLMVLAGICPSAGFDMPKSVYRLSELEKAQEEARAEGKPITIVYTTEQSTCGKCEDASLTAARELKSKSVVLYVNCMSEFGELPMEVQKGLKVKSLGMYIPKTIVMDAELKKLIAIIPYGSGLEYLDRIGEAKDNIRDAYAAREEEPETKFARKPAAPPVGTGEMRIWTAASGARVRASLADRLGHYVMLEKEDGSQLKILVSRLSEADQQYLRGESAEETGP